MLGVRVSGSHGTSELAFRVEGLEVERRGGPRPSRGCGSEGQLCHTIACE